MERFPPRRVLRSCVQVQMGFEFKEWHSEILIEFRCSIGVQGETIDTMIEADNRHMATRSALVQSDIVLGGPENQVEALRHLECARSRLERKARACSGRKICRSCQKERTMTKSVRR